MRTKETNFGNLVSDALLWKTGADLSITNCYNLRRSVPQGDLTNEMRMSMFNDMPFTIYTRDITGEEIYSMLEDSVANYPDMSPSFLQVGGIRFTFDPEAEAGGRIISVTFADGEAVDYGTTYTLAHYDALTEWKSDAIEGIDFITGYGSMPDALLEYIESGEELNPETDGRITSKDGGK